MADEPIPQPPAVSDGELSLLVRAIDDLGGRPHDAPRQALARVLEHVRDLGGTIDVAAEAIVMQPRPRWLVEFLPHGQVLPIPDRTAVR